MSAMLLSLAQIDAIRREEMMNDTRIDRELNEDDKKNDGRHKTGNLFTDVNDAEELKSVVMELDQMEKTLDEMIAARDQLRDKVKMLKKPQLLFMFLEYIMVREQQGGLVSVEVCNRAFADESVFAMKERLIMEDDLGSICLTRAGKEQVEDIIRRRRYLA